MCVSPWLVGQLGSGCVPKSALQAFCAGAAAGTLSPSLGRALWVPPTCFLGRALFSRVFPQGQVSSSFLAVAFSLQGLRHSCVSWAEGLGVLTV